MKIASLQPVDRIPSQPETNENPGNTSNGAIVKLIKKVEQQSRVLKQLDDVVSEFYQEFPQHTRSVPTIRLGEDPLIATIRYLVRSLDRQNQTYREANHEASTQGELEAAFLASVIHEIRAPIEGIQNLCQDGLNSPSSEENYARLDSIGDSAQSLLSILQDTQQNSRKRPNLESVPFCPVNVVKDVLMLFGPRAQAKGLQLQGFRSKAMPEAVIGDRRRIQQVLSNLVNNAIHFTESGSVNLTIDAEEEGDDWKLCFEVEDSGVGMTEEEISEIMRGERSRESGFGLTIAKTLVEQMEGQIEVESQKGSGSVFRVYLQLSADTPPPIRPMTPPQPAENEETDSSDLGVALVVEDDEKTQEVTQKALMALGYRVDVVGNGMDAISAASTKPYDLVCMDMLLPDINGMETTRRIRDLDTPTSKARILATTGHPIANERQRYQEAGMDDYLPKPFGVEQLREKLEVLSLLS